MIDRFNKGSIAYKITIILSVILGLGYGLMVPYSAVQIVDELHTSFIIQLITVALAIILLLVELILLDEWDKRICKTSKDNYKVEKRKAVPSQWLLNWYDFLQATFFSITFVIINGLVYLAIQWFLSGQITLYTTSMIQITYSVIPVAYGFVTIIEDYFNRKKTPQTK